MFVIHKLDKGPPMRIAIEGIIDETANFTLLSEIPGMELQLFCQKVTRINSIGVKLWVDSFNEFRKTNGKLRFIEISPDLVDSVNYISSFIKPEELVSLVVPYYCGKCKLPKVEIMTPQEIREQIKTLDAKPCHTCSETMEIECDPEEYFASIMRTTSG